MSERVTRQGKRAPLINHRDVAPLDNLYARLLGGPLITPNGLHKHVQCSKEDLKVNPWCGQHRMWGEDPNWGPCIAPS